MGRYYNGDIEGKFWFAVQSSGAPARFGATEFEPSHINYYLDDLDEVHRELNDIEKNMQGNIERLDDFFAQTNGYNDKMIIDWYKKEYKETINEEEVKDMLVEYADYELGKKIYECIKENGDCNINAEI
tara:strand:+ start:809 stop:1195 length:387 start_codon:yes stop_codon:yes gene_type:complete